ncbi:glutathione reductase (NADPH) [Enterococcus sp. DIV0182]|nr:hypothetical protein A5800_002489 [Enterococcus sp. 5B7_DIV0075]GMC02155.1 glutathione reductase [Enterococcus thailandicus]
MIKEYDTIVIGSGVAGLSAAYELKAKQQQVLVIEENLWGGTCPNRGCDPKKILIGGVEARNRIKQLLGKGFSEVPPLNWQELQSFKRTFTDPVSANRQKELSQAGIDHLTGTASFLDEETVEVLGKTFRGKHFVLATGQRPTILPIEGKEFLQTSTDFLALAELPKQLIFIGGGYVSFELATIARAAGSEVTIVHHNQRPLKEFDEELVQEAIVQMKKAGIQFAFDVNAQKITRQNEKLQLIAGKEIFEADAIFCATGRQPNVESLHLERANVDFTKKGIIVNECLQTTNPQIFACGDVIEKQLPKLTPVATFEGQYVAQKVTQQQQKIINYPVIPTIVYGSPKIATVGTTKIEEDRQVETVTQEMTSWFTYHRVNEPLAKVKLCFNKENFLIGASVLSEQADELIDFLTIAINQGLTKEIVDQWIFGYPTLASDLPYLLK